MLTYHQFCCNKDFCYKYSELSAKIFRAERQGKQTKDIEHNIFQRRGAIMKKKPQEKQQGCVLAQQINMEIIEEKESEFDKSEDLDETIVNMEKVQLIPELRSSVISAVHKHAGNCQHRSSVRSSVKKMDHILDDDTIKHDFSFSSVYSDEENVPPNKKTNS